MMPPAILPVLLLVALGAAFALLTQRVSRRLGRSANRFGAGDTAHDFVGRVYRVGGPILFAFLVARMVWPGIDAAVGVVPEVVGPSIAWLGLVIMFAGGAVILTAQVQMGTSWRIGLDQERTSLVTAGRLACFLGMVLVVLGVFLVAPTTVTGIVLAVAWITFSVQIRMEEEHLSRMHGAAYNRYRAAVARWLSLGFQTKGPAVRVRSVDHG